MKMMKNRIGQLAVLAGMGCSASSCLAQSYSVRSAVELSASMRVYEDFLGCPTQVFAQSRAWENCISSYLGRDNAWYTFFAFEGSVDSAVNENEPSESYTGEACLPGVSMDGMHAATNPPCTEFPQDPPQAYVHIQGAAQIRFPSPGFAPDSIITMSGSAGTTYVLDRPPQSWKIDVDGSGLSTNGGVGSMMAVLRGSFVHNGVTTSREIAAIIVVGSQVSSRNLTEVSAGVFESTLTESNTVGSPVGGLELYQVSDAGADFDGDGRFGSTDIAVLTGLIGQAWPNNLAARFDLDQDGIVDADEVAYMQHLLDIGLGAGNFGDLNRDGVTDCDDFALIPSGAFSATLGDADYRIELDLNLDGDVDDAEHLEFNKAVHHADFDLDGFVDGFDYDAFIDAFTLGTLPDADWNRDGFVDGFDYDDFDVDFTTAGC